MVEIPRMSIREAKKAPKLTLGKVATCGYLGLLKKTHSLLDPYCSIQQNSQAKPIPAKLFSELLASLSSHTCIYRLRRDSNDTSKT
jgi:hypothetical protein